VALWAWAGGWIVSLGEPMLDTIGHLWWPHNLPGPAFKIYNLDVPLLIPPCYVFFVAMTGYFAYRMFLRGVTTRQVFYVWLGIASTDLALELPGTSVHVYKYYGSQPFDVAGFPMHWAWMNGTGFLGVGLALFLLSRLKGRNRLLLVMAPTFGFLGAYGLTTWPAFISLNGGMSRFMMHVVDLGSLALCLLVVRGIAALVATDAPPLRLGGVGVGAGEPARVTNGSGPIEQQPPVPAGIGAG
jgi:hypothetical protein